MRLLNSSSIIISFLRYSADFDSNYSSYISCVMSIIEAQFYSFLALKFLRNSLKLGSRLAILLILSFRFLPGSSLYVYTNYCNFLISAIVFGLLATALLFGLFLLAKKSICDSWYLFLLGSLKICEGAFLDAKHIRC